MLSNVFQVFSCTVQEKECGGKRASLFNTKIGHYFTMCVIVNPCFAQTVVYIAIHNVL